MLTRVTRILPRVTWILTVVARITTDARILTGSWEIRGNWEKRENWGKGEVGGKERMWKGKGECEDFPEMKGKVYK